MPSKKLLGKKNKKKKHPQTYRGFWLAQVASSLFLSHLRDVSFLDVCSNQRKTDMLVLPVQKMKIKTHSLYLHPRVTVHTRICCFPEEVCSHLEKHQYPESERLQLSQSCKQPLPAWIHNLNGGKSYGRADTNCYISLHSLMSNTQNCSILQMIHLSFHFTASAKMMALSLCGQTHSKLTWSLKSFD